MKTKFRCETIDGRKEKDKFINGLFDVIFFIEFNVLMYPFYYAYCNLCLIQRNTDMIDKNKIISMKRVSFKLSSALIRVFFFVISLACPVFNDSVSVYNRYSMEEKGTLVVSSAWIVLREEEWKSM